MELSTTVLGHTYARAREPALDRVTLSLSEGVTAVVGVNGAGKSTMMRILARALRPTTGTVRLDGQDLHRTPRRLIASRIGFMPQDFSLPPGTRVLDGLAYLAWLKGVPTEDALPRSSAVLASLGLADRSGDLVATLSGGMVRRLALAQALVSNPDVLLLDEPTTGLDPEHRAAVRDLLESPAHRAPITLVSSHLMEDVERLADDVVLLVGGTVRFAGTTASFRTRPDGMLESAESAFLRRLIAVVG